ncbi:MAG: hypothetical protein R3F43_09790 [bacterium]
MAEAVRASELVAEPTPLLKTLFRGTALDVELLAQVRSRSPVRLADRWVGHNGYQHLRTSSKVRPGESEPGCSGQARTGMPDLGSEADWSPICHPRLVSTASDSTSSGPSPTIGVPS